MKNLKAKLKKNESQDWSKSDERLLQAVGQNEPDKVAALIVKKGLCPTKLDAEGKSAFHLCASQGHLDCLEVILAHGPDINVTDGSGFSAIHLAAKNGQPECLKRLLQERLPVDSTDSFGQTALHHAAVSGCLSCTETLWDFKASLDAQDGDGVSPLILGAQMSGVELSAFLLDRGANPNIQDNQGRSALMLAYESDSAETVEVLLRGGANPQLADAFRHDAAHYGVTAGNQWIAQLLQNCLPATEGNGEERQPPPPPPLPGGTTPRKRKAPPPPHSPPQDSPSLPSPAPQSSPPPASPSAQSPETRRSNQANLTENEEVFEEIRRLRLERKRLLQKIKGLEQQNSALTDLEELTQLRECLEQAEAERDRLQTELEELKAGQVIGASDSDDDILDFPVAEKLLSRRSRESPSALDEEEAHSSTSPGPADPDTVAELCRQVDELTSQNQELVLKVQMLEMFEKDDPDMQTTGPDFVPTALYDSLRKEFEALQERYSQAQASAEASSMAGEGCEETVAGGGEGETEKQLGHSQSELEELREQVHLGVYSGEQAGGMGGERETPRGSGEVVSLETQQLRERREGEGESAEDNDTVKQLRKKVEELQAALEEKGTDKEFEKEDGGGESERVRSLRERVSELEATLAESKESGRAGGGREKVVESDGEVLLRLQGRVVELERELRDCVPRSEMDEVQVTLGLQCEQLARERSEASLRLNEALLELDRLRSPSPKHCQGDEEERSEGSEPSITSERSLRRVREELEVARQEAAQAPDCLCAEREGRSQDTLHLRHAVPLSQHTEALTALSEQLAQTAQELQAERALRCHAQTETARLEAQLQATQQDLIPWEEHDKVKAELQRSLQASESSAAEAKEALSVKETELRDLRCQKAVEQGLVSKEDHESQRLSLQAEINAFTAQFNNLTRNHQKTCTEVFQVQREALFNKSECQVAEAQLATAQQQLADLQAQSSHVQELQKDIQDSQALVKEKDCKIIELSKEVFCLKEAVEALSPPLGFSSSSHSSSQSQSERVHPGNPGQQVSLQNRVAILSKEIQDWERTHRQVIAVYRSHLLAAVQGRMDGEVQGLLLQILSMSHKDQGH
ncbi:ankyrin repeat domain-containing protein 24 [Salmo trutta]|uniref:ankyrin repeat domain-containing protein 24 n=1 Tax=Salmo trutta TaxID=8032 RepID=UPI0011327E69|nr:ankyrin repeat domain-containing protein 24-like [Salmo trutta]